MEDVGTAGGHLSAIVTVQSNVSRLKCQLKSSEAQQKRSLFFWPGSVQTVGHVTVAAVTDSLLVSYRLTVAAAAAKFGRGGSGHLACNFHVGRGQEAADE